jgi:hypothetical protein
MPLGNKAFDNIAGKGENAGNQHFLLFPLFSTLSKTEILFFCCSICRLQML